MSDTSFKKALPDPLPCLEFLEVGLGVPSRCVLEILPILPHPAPVANARLTSLNPITRGSIPRQLLCSSVVMSSIISSIGLGKPNDTRRGAVPLPLLTHRHKRVLDRMCQPERARSPGRRDRE